MKFNRNALCLLATVSVFLSLKTNASAQEDPQDILNEQAQDTRDAATRSPGHFITEVGYVSQSKADIDGGGSMEVDRFDAGLIYQTKLGDEYHLAFSFSLGVNNYDFSSSGFGGPWDTVIFARHGAQLSRNLNDKWSVRGGGVLMSSRESGADLGDSITGGLSLGADYRYSPTLFLSGGLAIISQLEDDAQVFPMLAVNWKLDGQWLIRFGSIPFSGGAAIGMEAEYKLSEKIELAGGLLYNQRRFRLDDSGSVPDGVGEENTLPIRLRLGWSINEKASLHLIGGVVAGGELQLENSGGQRLAQQDYDPAPYFAVRALFRF